MCGSLVAATVRTQRTTSRREYRPHDGRPASGRGPLRRPCRRVGWSGVVVSARPTTRTRTRTLHHLRRSDRHQSWCRRLPERTTRTTLAAGVTLGLTRRVVGEYTRSAVGTVRARRVGVGPGAATADPTSLYPCHQAVNLALRSCSLALTAGCSAPSLWPRRPRRECADVTAAGSTPRGASGHPQRTPPDGSPSRALPTPSSSTT
ncbi:hypothetical protein FJT64_017235 [Amphibalanus amphitrite]|uniref:Uncharacterized protein n=1 Tax=Amphibalanus amphitrite TaxID=1232801 RepID=A0A6A4WY29_AMPAM|nr:hypothetical protein FJT64_017235 [Amphibalanus amphitrite]